MRSSKNTLSGSSIRYLKCNSISALLGSTFLPSFHILDHFLSNDRIALGQIEGNRAPASSRVAQGGIISFKEKA